MSEHATNTRRAPAGALKLAAAIVAACTLFFAPLSTLAEEAKEAPAKPSGMPVEAVMVTTAPIKRELSSVGTLKSAESVMVSTEIAGKVTGISFAEGEKVSRGDILVRLDDALLRAQFDQAKAKQELSAANYSRAESLLKDQAIAERDRDEAYATWQLDEASLRLAQVNLDKSVIRAPFAGTVGLRDLSPGSYLRPGDAVVSLEATNPIRLDTRVPETYAREVAVGQEVSIGVDALPGQNFTGKVTALAPQIDQQGRSLLVRATIANPNGELLPGMFARVSLVLEERPDALIIPEQALVPQGSSHLVYKIVDGKIEAVEVTLGIRRKGEVEIRSGLAAGDQIVTAGHLKVRPGSPVMVLPLPAKE